MTDGHCETLTDIACGLRDAQSIASGLCDSLPQQLNEANLLADAVIAIDNEHSQTLETLAAEELPIREHKEATLVEETQCRETLSEANNDLEAAQKALALAQEKQRAALKKQLHATQQVKQYDAELTKVLDQKRVHEAHHQSAHTLREMLVASTTAKCDAWEAWQDKIASAGALDRLNGDDDMKTLLASLGYCEWFTLLKKRGVVEPGVLPSLGEALLRDAVKSSGRTSFGQVRRFSLAIQQIQRGDGLPRWCALEEETQRASRQQVSTTMLS
jgi:hypothetical protein